MRLHHFQNLGYEDWLALLFVLISIYGLFRVFRLGEDRWAWKHNFSGHAVLFGMPLWLIAGVSALLPWAWQCGTWVLTAAVCAACLVRIFTLPARRAILLTLFIVSVGLAAFPVSRLITERIIGRPPLSAGDQSQPS